MNHLLQDAKSGAPSEYNEIEETMSPRALKVITGWLSTNVLARRGAELNVPGKADRAANIT